MSFEITQSLQQKFQQRVERLKNVDARLLPSAMRQFFTFLQDEPFFRGVLDEIEVKLNSDKSPSIACETNDITKIESENELIKFIYPQLKTLANNLYSSFPEQLASQWNYYLTGNLQLDAKEFIFKELIQPFCNYFFEKLEDQRFILRLLYRYKHRCEWFQRERLLQLYKSETKKGEKLLALDLYQYLFDEGINFTIEPSSIDGAIDLISGQNSEDPLLADAKIFSGNKTYICEGFGQIYRYTGKYNEPFGYLVIYNVTNKEISFLFKNSRSSIPFVTFNHKTIFFITIDLFEHTKPTSKRKKIKPVEIKQEDLFQLVEAD